MYVVCNSVVSMFFDSRQLLCEVVRIKAEGEETTNRIGRCNGEEIIMVRTGIYTCTCIILAG